MRFTGTLFGIVAAFALAQPATGSTLTSKQAAAIDAIFAEKITPQSPGCGVGLIRNGEIIEFRGYGLADVEKRVPWTPQTVFHPGSIYKHFQAAAMVMLARQGKLSLDDDIRKYLPEIPDYGARITIRNLLNHTHGLREYPDLIELTPADAPTGNDAILRMISRQHEPAAPPGARFEYGNTGPFLASRIIERVTGGLAGEFAGRSILDPAGMHNTAVARDTRDVPPNTPGYERQPDGTFKGRSQGAARTTLEDFAKWSRQFEATDPALTDALREIMAPTTLNDGTSADAGMSLRLRPYRGMRRVWAPGGATGYRAIFMRFPDAQMTIAMGCNHDMLDPVRAAELIADVVLAQKMSPAERAAMRKPRRVTLSKQQLQSIAGMYVSHFGFVVRVAARDGKPFMISDNGEFEMFPAGGRFVFDNKPFILRDGATEARFWMAKSGERNLELKTVWNPWHFVAVKPIDPSAVPRDDYLGKYSNDEVESDLDVSLRDGALFLKTARAEYTMEPLTKDLFRAGPQIVRFMRNDGRVTAVQVWRGQIELTFRRNDRASRTGVAAEHAADN